MRTKAATDITSHLFETSTTTDNAPTSLQMRDSSEVKRTYSFAAAALAATLLLGAGTGTANIFIDTSTGWTTSGVVEVSRRQSNELALQLQQLKDSTGLTWSQLAALFGVTRRAVHFWARGGNITDDHLLRLQRLQEQLRSHVSDDPASTRTALMVPDGSGRSLWGHLVDEISPPPPFSALDRLGGAVDSLQ
jgi:hypothetical protein